MPPAAEPEHRVLRPGGISYLRIPASDPQASASFCDAVFGWRARSDRPDAAFQDGRGHVIGRFRPDHAVAAD